MASLPVSSVASPCETEVTQPSVSVASPCETEVTQPSVSVASPCETEVTQPSVSVASPCETEVTQPSVLVVDDDLGDGNFLRRHSSRHFDFKPKKKRGGKKGGGKRKGGSQLVSVREQTGSPSTLAATTSGGVKTDVGSHSPQASASTASVLPTTPPVWADLNNSPPCATSLLHSTSSTHLLLQPDLHEPPQSPTQSPPDSPTRPHQATVELTSLGQETWPDDQRPTSELGCQDTVSGKRTVRVLVSHSHPSSASSVHTRHDLASNTDLHLVMQADTPSSTASLLEDQDSHIGTQSDNTTVTSDTEGGDMEQVSDSDSDESNPKTGSSQDHVQDTGYTHTLRHGSSDELMHTGPEQEPEKAAQEPEKAAQEPEKAAQEPEKAAQEPEKAAQEPEKAAQEPEKAAQEPEKAAQEPEKGVDEARVPPGGMEVMVAVETDSLVLETLDLVTDPQHSASGHILVTDLDADLDTAAVAAAAGAAEEGQSGSCHVTPSGSQESLNSCVNLEESVPKVPEPKNRLRNKISRKLSNARKDSAGKYQKKSEKHKKAEKEEVEEHSSLDVFGSAFKLTGLSSNKKSRKSRKQKTDTHKSKSGHTDTDKVKSASRMGAVDGIVKIIPVKLGSLSKDKTDSQKKEKDGRHEEPETFHSPEACTAADTHSDQLIQRCVIIQKDERGYGLTVSGDNPVFVQSVKENGAAVRAGVQKGDRIIKVNGTLVTNSNHIEVVKMIKSGSYVALTLLGRPPGQGHRPLDPPTPGSGIHHVTSPTSRSSSISGPHAVNTEKSQEFMSQKIATIRMMYEQVAAECEKIREQLARGSTENVQANLEDKQKMMKTLEQQLYALTGIHAESHTVPPATAVSPRPVGSSSPLPLASGTNLPVSPVRRYGSGDGLDLIHEESDRESWQGDNSVLSPSPAHKHNPAPWLPGGPRHRKTESMPESFYDNEADPTGGRDVTVSRSHSDSQKRKTPSAETEEKHRELATARRRRMMNKASSLPSGMYDSGQSPDQSPNHSPVTSPVPAREVREVWSEASLMDTTDETLASPLGVSTEDINQSAQPLHQILPQQANVISVDDDDFSTDEEHLEDHGPFSDLNMLKHKPAHLAVFLHYLISNSDPSPLLFYLVTEGYTQGNMKEMRKWAYEINSTFLLEGAPLRIDTDSDLLVNINYTLQYKQDKEDAFRPIFQLARHMAQKDIGDLLQDFRNKRALGLGSLYGDHELQDDHMDRQAELRIVEKYLWPHVERLLENEEASDRNRAMASALATFLRQVGFSKSNSSLERCQSFVTKDKKMFKFTKSNKKSHYERGHQFVAQHYYSTTYCSSCHHILWGVGNQGYQCVNCEYNIHKSCLQKVKDGCVGQKKKRQSMLDKIITRKPSSNNPAAIKEAQAQRLSHSEDISSLSSPTSQSLTPSTSAVFNIRSATNEEEEEIVGEAQRQQEERESRLRGLGVQRTVSLPSVHETSRSAAKTTTIYMQAQHQPPYHKLSVRFSDDDGNTEQLRTGGKVPEIVERLEGISSPEDSRSGVTPPRPSSPDHSQQDDHRKTALGRSESLNKKRESRKSVRRTRSDVQVDETTIKSLNQSASSSNSSLSTRSLDSPSHSHEGLTELVQRQQQAHDDSDLEVETELPSLDSTIAKDVLKKLKPKEKKRQEVLNELLHTEKAHVRNLKVMHRLFSIPLSQDPSLTALNKLLFPNIEEVIQVHCSLNNAFKAKKKENPLVGEIGQTLLDRFEDEAGVKFQTACATFCRSQSHALDVLRNKQRKDQKLAMFLQEAASNPMCRRLELKDYLPTAMQRLTKYPLLIESLLKYTQSSNKDHERLQRALQCSKKILNHVNQAVRDYENHQKLVDLQKKIDRRPIENSTHPLLSEYKNLDLTRHKMIHDGGLTWRVGRQKQVEVHALLLEDILVLLHKTDEKLVLRCQSTVVVADTKFTHSPIIKLTNLLTRNVATDKRAFFLVSTSQMGPQIYELVAHSLDERKKWFKYISDAAEAYKSKESRRVLTKVPAFGSPAAEPSVKDQLSHDNIQIDNKAGEEPPPYEELYGKDDSFERQSRSLDSLEDVGQVGVERIDQPALIQPTEVVVSREVVVSEEVLTERAHTLPGPQELLRQKDELIQKTMEEKNELVAQLLNVPAPEYQHIAEMASEVEGEKEGRELVLGCIEQTSQLQQLVTNSLQVPAHGQSGAGVGEESPSGLTVTLASQQLLHITAKLNQQLTQLLGVLASRDEPLTPISTQRDSDSNRSHSEEESRGGTLTPFTSPLAVLDEQQAETSSDSTPHQSRPHSFISVSSTSDSGELQEELSVVAATDQPHTTALSSGEIQALSASHQSVEVIEVAEIQKLELVAVLDHQQELGHTDLDLSPQKVVEVREDTEVVRPETVRLIVEERDSDTDSGEATQSSRRDIAVTGQGLGGEDSRTELDRLVEVEDGTSSSSDSEESSTERFLDAESSSLQADEDDTNHNRSETGTDTDSNNVIAASF